MYLKVICFIKESKVKHTAQYPKTKKNNIPAWSMLKEKYVVLFLYFKKLDRFYEKTVFLILIYIFLVLGEEDKI